MVLSSVGADVKVGEEEEENDPHAIANQPSAQRPTAINTTHIKVEEEEGCHAVQRKLEDLQRGQVLLPPDIRHVPRLLCIVIIHQHMYRCEREKGKCKEMCPTTGRGEGG